MRPFSSTEEEQRRIRDLGTLLDLPVVRCPIGRGHDHESSGKCPPEPMVDHATNLPLDAKAKRYLEVIVSNPGKPSSAYAKLARISNKTALAVRRRLIELGLLKEESLNANARGRSVILLRPTEAALRLVEEPGNETQ